MSDSTQPVLNVPAGVSAPESPAAPPAPSPAPAGTLGPLAPERPEKAPRRGSARGIPAAPTALAALNATAVAGAGAAHAFGPTGAALAAGAALLAATSVGAGSAKSAARKAARSAAVRAARSTGSSVGPLGSKSRRTGGGGGLNSPSTRSGSLKNSGKTGSPWSPLRSGPTSTSSPLGSAGKHRKSGSTGGGSGSIRPGSGVRPGSASPIGARSGSGRGGSSLGKSGSTTRAGSTGGGSGPKSRSSRPGGTKSGSTSLARRAARALVKRSDGSRREPIKAMKNAARAIKAGAKKVGRGAKKVWNSKPGRAMRKAATAVGRQGWRVARTVGAGVWAAIGRKGWREILRAMKAAWSRNKETGAPAPTPGVPGTKVTMPATLVGGAASGTAPAPTGGGFSMSQARFLEAAAEMLGAAMVYRPDGMMQVGNDFARMPEAYRNIANAMKTMAQRAHDEDPIHPAILDTMGQMYQKLNEVADMAEQLAPAFKALHAVDIARIESPRRGEEKWDISRNRDHAGSGASAPSYYGTP